MNHNITDTELEYGFIDNPDLIEKSKLKQGHIFNYVVFNYISGYSRKFFDHNKGKYHVQNENEARTDDTRINGFTIPFRGLTDYDVDIVYYEDTNSLEVTELPSRHGKTPQVDSSGAPLGLSDVTSSLSEQASYIRQLIVEKKENGGAR